MFMLQKMHAQRSINTAEGPSFRSVTTVSNSTQNQSVSAPSGQLTGDLLIAIVGCQNASTFTTPAGWTLATSGVFNAAGFYVFYKVAASNGEAVTINSSGAGNRTIIYAAYRNVLGVNIGTRTESTGITIASVTATAPGMRLAMTMIDIASATLTAAPSGMDQIALVESPNLGAGLWHKTNEPAGASPTATVTWNNAADKAGIQLHLY